MRFSDTSIWKGDISLRKQQPGSKLGKWLCVGLVCVFVFFVPIRSPAECTAIIVGKKATVDGSVLVVHTDCCSNSRIHVVPAKSYKKGERAPVYYGIQDVRRPLHDYGEIIGYIPQVEHTYAYIHSGYPHINEHQLAIGEATILQRPELRAIRSRGAKQIMTVEQAMLFALQRCKTAREALELITSLLEEYGFLSSCCGPDADGGEALLIADSDEAWDLEIFGVGMDWEPGSDRPGVIWAAQRVPDDHVFVMPNYPRIRKIDLSDTENFRASSNYKQIAVEHGWYDPEGGDPFYWQEAYTYLPSDWNLPRMWLLCQTFAPNYKNKGFENAWATRTAGRGMFKDSYETIRATKFTADYFPFSIKPEKKVSVQDIMAYVRSTFEGTYWDMTADRDWLVPDGEGGFVKSPLTTPFPNAHWRELLDITHHRNVSQTGAYAMISQLRGWLPDPVGGIYWFVVDNYKHSPFIPVYCGISEISPLYNTYDPDNFQEDSARWVYDFADTLLQLEYQNAVRDLLAVRDPFESMIFADQEKTEKEAVRLHRDNHKAAVKYLTGYVRDLMEDAVQRYRELRYTLIEKYKNRP